ncbi:efflux transporter outer membrane subunit [Methylocystis rosea]|uniref:Efflux transporter outer membrane subunit n=1 Tax=Methylocystis rosea TaxID=173366 RepID=A0A3G8M8G9_9HYPH|nr:efflux transporter outer membrane subunit [Methylocystis rosea]AZG77370.1 efflux transporter outer membrane subunit [Methylocystis rosea]
MGDRLALPLESPKARNIAQSDRRQGTLKSKGRAAALGLLLAALLSGCAVGPDFVAPEAPLGAGYAAGKPANITQSAPIAGGGAQKLVPGRDIPGEWWRLFRSKQIAALVAEAVTNHPNIAAAEAALRQARETTEADAASFFPSATLSQSVARTQMTTAQFGGFSQSSSSSGSQGSSSSGATALLYTLHNSNVAVSFTPDVFGKTMRTVESDFAAAEYQRFQLEATYLALAANVVTAAIADSNYASQIKVTRDLIAAYQKQLDILQKRFELGAVSAADVVSEKALVAQAQATLPPLEKARAQTRNQLMAYLGRFPNDDKGEAIDIEHLHLPRDLPLSLPSNLVRQRPDVLSAEAQLHQASANVGVATANMLPQLTLTGNGGSQASNFSQLFLPQTSVYNLATQLSGQAFDAGKLFHQREAKLAALEQAEAQYRATVISAFQNVADALQAIKHDAATLRAQVAAEKAAAESLDISQAQYLAGSTTYPTVLNAAQTLLNARLNRVQAQAARFSDTAALMQALGGGWWNRLDETPASLPKPTDLISTLPIAAAIRAEAEERSRAR